MKLYNENSIVISTGIPLHSEVYSKYFRDCGHMHSGTSIVEVSMMDEPTHACEQDLFLHGLSEIMKSIFCVKVLGFEYHGC